MKPQKMILSWMFQCLMSIQTFFHCPSLNNKQKYAFLIDWISSATTKGDLCPWFLIRKAIWYVSNWWIFRIFTQPIPIFFFKVQNWDSQQRAETAAISNFDITSNLTIPNWLMTCQKHKYWTNFWSSADMDGNFIVQFDTLPDIIGLDSFK